jgi:hypothetical protein
VKNLALLELESFPRLNRPLLPFVLGIRQSSPLFRRRADLLVSKGSSHNQFKQSGVLDLVLNVGARPTGIVCGEASATISSGKANAVVYDDVILLRSLIEEIRRAWPGKSAKAVRREEVIGWNRDRKDRHRIEAGIETLQYFGEWRTPATVLEGLCHTGTFEFERGHCWRGTLLLGANVRRRTDETRSRAPRWANWSWWA